MKKSKNDALQNLTEVQLLAGAGVIVGKQVSYAALILFGNRKALANFYLRQKSSSSTARQNVAITTDRISAGVLRYLRRL